MKKSKKKSNLTFADAHTGRVISGVLTYEPDAPHGTNCERCPLRRFPGGSPYRRCAVTNEDNYDYMLPLVDDEVPFMDKERIDIRFCHEVKIVAFDITRIEDIDVCRKKYSLKNLLGKVCSGRCILLDNPKDCTEEHRKCPGCLLGELIEED